MFVVAGVSGNTGKVVADALLAEKKPVRVIVREQAKGTAFAARGAEVAVAELDDAAALAKALAGATGAYLLLPPSFGSTSVREDNARRTQSIVRAVEESGVRHVVFLSSIGAQHAKETGPIGSIHDAEAALRKVKADVTFVRAAYFMENWGGSLYALGEGKLPSFLLGDRKIPMIATQDIGLVAAQALLEGGHGKTVIELAGPEDYSPRDVAQILSRVAKRPVELQVGPEEAMVPALTAAGLSTHWAGLFQEMTHGINTGLVAWEGGGARSVRGKVPVADVLAKLVGGSH